MKHCYIFFLLIATTVTAQTDCANYSENYVPKSLDDAMAFMDCNWKDREVFKQKEEKDAVADEHFAKGRWIRNGWGLSEAKNPLYKQFKSLGVTFPEDISTVILTSYHRHLNNRPIDLDGQISDFKKSKRRIELSKLNRDELAKKLRPGDTVEVTFARNPDKKDSYSLALLNYEGSLTKPTNCVVQGCVTKKWKEKGSTLLAIQITKPVNCDSSYYNKTLMTKGGSFSYNMSYFNLRLP